MQKQLVPVLMLSIAGSMAISEPVVASGDAEAGKIKSYTCTGCHGIPGYKNVYPTYHVPKIGGQNEAYLDASLKAYRAGERQHKTMVLQAESLSDQDIADIAAYFASLGGGEGE
jgi:cytochrome c553